MIIALMGETGSGKSSFIQNVTGSKSVKIGHGLESGSFLLTRIERHHWQRSETLKVEAYSISIGGRVVTLVDTPGFDDTYKSDVEVLLSV